MTHRRLAFTKHATDGTIELGLTSADVSAVISANDVIEPAETATSGRLIFGIVNGKPVHVVARRFEDGMELVITVYRPNSTIFENDLRTRRRKGK